MRTEAGEISGYSAVNNPVGGLRPVNILYYCSSLSPVFYVECAEYKPVLEKTNSQLKYVLVTSSILFILNFTTKFEVIELKF